MVPEKRELEREDSLNPIPLPQIAQITQIIIKKRVIETSLTLLNFHICIFSHFSLFPFPHFHILTFAYFPIFPLVPRFVFNQQSECLIIRNIFPHPVEQDEYFIFYAYNGEKVHDRP